VARKILETSVSFVREIVNHEHRDWIRSDDSKTSSWGFECRVCGNSYLIALEIFRFEGGDRYSIALRDCVRDPQRHDFLETILKFPCSYCGTSEGVRIETCQTNYDDSRIRTRFERILEPEPEDPNIDPALCRDCSEDYHSYWTEMWTEYRNSVM
jgi:hypothetical protein